MEYIILPASKGWILKNFGNAKSVQLNSTSDFWVTQKEKEGNCTPATCELVGF